jgi:hypothetical protein
MRSYIGFTIIFLLGAASSLIISQVYFRYQYGQQVRLLASELNSHQARERAFDIAQGLEDYLMTVPHLASPRVRGGAGAANGSPPEDGVIANRSLLIDFSFEEAKGRQETVAFAKAVLSEFKGWPDASMIEWEIEGFAESGHVIVDLKFTYRPDLFPFAIEGDEHVKWLPITSGR